MTAARRTAVIIEHDGDARSVLDEVLRAAGLQPIVVDLDADPVETVRQHQPLITVMNVDRPGVDDFAAVRQVRAASDTYILMLADPADEADIVRGLSEGADGYLTKPVRPLELRARLEAVMRRPGPDIAPMEAPAASGPARNPSAEAGISDPGSDDVDDEDDQWVSYAGLSLNLQTRIVLVEQQEVALTPAEFALLATLLRSKRRVRSTSDLALVLAGQLPGEWYEVADAQKRGIEERMNALRYKLGDDGTKYIEVIEGAGYRLSGGESAASS